MTDKQITQLQTYLLSHGYENVEFQYAESAPIYIDYQDRNGVLAFLELHEIKYEVKPVFQDGKESQFIKKVLVD